jgi:hypothetical protein
LSDDDKTVTLQSSGGQTVVIDDSNGKITLRNGESVIEIDRSGTIKLSGAKIELNAPVIALGDNPSGHPLVLGDQLLAWLNTHVHGSAAPSNLTSPPNVPALPGMLSTTSVTS